VPDVRVSPWALAAMAALVAVFFMFAVRAAMRLRHRPPVAGGLERIVGAEGTVVGEGLDPEGVVRVAAEEWRAVAGGTAPIPAGSRVRVTAHEGLRLTVERVGHDQASPGGTAAPGLGERTTT
jgi:membrane-bound ClpP family serine protease